MSTRIFSQVNSKGKELEDNEEYHTDDYESSCPCYFYFSSKRGEVKEYPDEKNTISYAYAITRQEWNAWKR